MLIVQQPVFVPAVYDPATFLRPETASTLSSAMVYDKVANASFPLHPFKALRFDLPDGSDGEVIISRSDSKAEGSIVIETLWTAEAGSEVEEDEASVAVKGVGLWSDDFETSIAVEVCLTSSQGHHVLVRPGR